MVLWIGLLKLNHIDLKLSWTAFKPITTAITIDSIVVLTFIRWAWKWPIFKGWLVEQPNLQGTWSGVIKSTWLNPETNSELPPIPIKLIIRQTFLTLSCTLHTAESVSHSFVASIKIDDSCGAKHLVYSYSNKPSLEVRHRSEAHEGTAILDIVNLSPLVLKGEYWTNRKTTGRMNLMFESKSLEEVFSLSELHSEMLGGRHEVKY